MFEYISVKRMFLAAEFKVFIYDEKPQKSQRKLLCFDDSFSIKKNQSEFSIDRLTSRLSAR